MKKLEIPAPDEEVQEDDTALSLELWVGCSLALVAAFFGWFLWPTPEVEPDPYAHIEDPEQREIKRDHDEFASMVEEGRIDNVDWREDEARALRVFEVGPRQAAEVVCHDYEDAIGAGELSRSLNLALLRAVDRRRSDAPWSCLTRMYLEGELSAEDALSEEVAAFWEEVTLEGEHGQIMREVARDFGAQERLFESEQFERWLRRCAVSPQYPAADICREIVRDRAPKFGDDLLEVLIGLLADPEVSQSDLRFSATALGEFADRGQPEQWHIAETGSLPDYDVDFRLGSLFMLCRLMNSPDEKVQQSAAEALGRVSGVGGRRADDKMRYRWQGTCRRAFGNPQLPQMDAPFLGVAVWDNGELSTDYSLDTLIESDLCTEWEERPSWYCGARRWTGGGQPMARVLGNFFARTAYIEWVEDGDPSFVLPGD